MRFAVLHHNHPFIHWDLLLETPALCWTWRLLDAPQTTGCLRAERIADHRPFYLDYEGPVSGDRGTVAQWDAGTWIWTTASPIRVMGLVSGRHWRGRITLSADFAGIWRLEYEPAEKNPLEGNPFRPAD